MKNQCAKMALLTASFSLFFLGGCAAPQGKGPAPSALPQFISTTIDSSTCKLVFSAAVGSPASKSGSNVCMITLKNVGDTEVEIPDLDIGRHLSIYVKLLDDQGVEAPLSALGQDQFHNFSASFVQSRDLNPRESISWRLELEKSFNLSPGHSYTMDIFYACHNTARLPDIELSGIRVGE
jgi:hypothetical protein